MSICLNCDWKEKYPDIPWPGFKLVEGQGWSREQVLNQLKYDGDGKYSLDGVTWFEGENYAELHPPPPPPEPKPPEPKPWELNPDEWYEVKTPFGITHRLKPKEGSKREILEKLDEIRKFVEALDIPGDTGGNETVK